MTAATPDISMAAVGDLMLVRQLSETGCDGFHDAVDILQDADVAYGNLETLVHDFEGYPAGAKGGTYMQASPRVAREIGRYGIDVVSAATNHSFDYSYGGLQATMRELDEHDVHHAGIGESLAEARRPAYVDTPAGRVALVAACSSITPGSVAGKPGDSVAARPGLSPLRYDVVYEVPSDTYETLVRMSEELGLERRKRIHVNASFSGRDWENDDVFRLLACGGDTHPRIVESDEFRVKLVPNKSDLKAIRQQIRAARANADWVLASLHAHEGAGARFNDRTVPRFAESFAKHCIDAGADAVVGHGPHVVRPIEIYDGAPIFYSLGNFVAHYYLIDEFPPDTYETSDLPESAPVPDLFKYRDETASADEKWGNFSDNDAYWESILPVVEFADGELDEIRLYPLDLLPDHPSPKRGTPTVVDGQRAAEILSDVQELSREFGTDVAIEEGVGVIAP